MAHGHVELPELDEIEVTEIPEGQVGPYLRDNGLEDTRPAMDRLRDAVAGSRADEVVQIVGELRSRDKARVLRDAALLANVVRTAGADNALGVMTTLGCTPQQKLTTAKQAGLLTLELAREIIGALDARRQEPLATNAGVVEAVKDLGAMTAVFVELCADSGRYARVVKRSEPFRTWAMTDPAAFRQSVLAGTPDKAEWCKTFKSLADWNLLLDIEADAGEANTWRAEAVRYYKNIVASLTTPLAADADGNRRATALYSLYGDGAGIGRDDKIKTFAALYTTTLETSGEHKFPGNFNSGQPLFSQVGITGTAAELFPTDYEDTYRVVKPTAEAMDLFFGQYRQLPRAHINTAAALYMSHDWFSKWTIHVTAGAGGRRARDVTAYQSDTTGENIQRSVKRFVLNTSYYMSDNTICMLSTSARRGAPATNTLGRTTYQTTAGDGTTTSHDIGVAVDGTPTTAEADRINLFQNHATHEVGHAVGNRQVALKNPDGTVWNTISGNHWAQQYGDWTRVGNLATARREFAIQHGWNVAWDANNYPLAKPDGSGNINATGLEIRDFLCACAEQGTSNVSDGLAGAAKFGDPWDARFAIEDCATVPPDFESLGLWDRADFSPDNQFRFPAGFQGGTTDVHFWCTRADTAGYFKYSRAAYNGQVSEYGLSSSAEMFAELYTAWFSGNHGIATVNGKNPTDFFTRLERAEAADFGAPNSDQPALGRVGGADSHGGLPADMLQTDPAAGAESAGGGGGEPVRPPASFGYRSPWGGTGGG